MRQCVITRRFQDLKTDYWWLKLVTTSDWPLPPHCSATIALGKHYQQALSNNILLLFTVSSRHCILRQFDKPTSAWILYAARDGQLSSAPAVSPQRGENEDWRRRRQTGVFHVSEPQSDGILLKFPQVKTLLNNLSFSGPDPAAGSWRHSMNNLCPYIHFQFYHDCLMLKLPPFFPDGDPFHSQSAHPGLVCGCGPLSPGWTYILPRRGPSGRRAWMEGWVCWRKR